MADSRVIQVSGLPVRLYDDDLVRDKLLIHFLRSKNGGGCDLDVRYPTEEEGVATLTFEQEEVVKRMLGKKHTLEISDCTYPLTVRQPLRHGSEFSLPIRAALSLKYFSDVLEVTRLLRESNLRISEKSRGTRLYIEGNFHDLRQCRDKLYEKLGGHLLRTPNGEETPTPSSKFHHTSADTENRPPRHNNPPTNVTNSRRSKNASEVANDYDLNSSASRQHKGDFIKPSANISYTKAANESLSPLPRDKSSTPTHTENVHASSAVSRSLYLDAGVYSYVMTFERSMIDNILRFCSLDMTLEDCGNCIGITLTAKSPYSSALLQYGLDKMTKLFACYEANLHRDCVKLPVIAGSSREEVAKSLQRHLLKQDIYAWRSQNSLNLIGPPDKILKFKQEWESTQPRNEKKMSSDSHPPTEGPTNVHIAPQGKTQVADGKPRAREPSQGPASRGRGIPQEVNRRGAPSASPQKPQWR
ncbi:RNA-binding protein 43 [Pseudophryne corroboree]|uniref:RNA-binding protein 43 n=1 Tax=Pseudophryne corroboree TaxID=495146 RepID=UPI003081EAB3